MFKRLRILIEVLMFSVYLLSPEDTEIKLASWNQIATPILITILNVAYSNIVDRKQLICDRMTLKQQIEIGAGRAQQIPDLTEVRK